ncbi:hypothetical protein HB779_24640 (plasmid) [Phyllobacterium sp. 628]|uniref:hypothetical protein n=1 Tax=Phyllobacterium sp. 628 TaxID=2718938 RepID=UPI001662685E|nr:hypothetical protein [Phyllobacterium sp. 628]QND55052.1 hypothetical protein HB779_24640 [Phyllobacterium sp. 628]
MPQTYADLTIAEALSDPMINAVMNADHVTRKEFELLMKSVARRNFQKVAAVEWQRAAAPDVILEPDNALLSGTRIPAAGCEGVA